MYKVFNKPALSRKERFSRALLMGFGASVAMIIIYFLVDRVLSANGLAIPDIFYVAFGYGIGNVIQYFGHGVQLRFSVLSVVLTILVITLCDLICYGGNFSSLVLVFYDIYGLICRGAALYFAFTEARIVKGR